MISDVFDTVILGAGIAGASLAWRLSSHQRVALVERESQPGYHSTGRSAAMFMESYGPPGVRALTRASRAFYEHPPEDFGTHPIMQPRGALYVAAHGQEALMAQTWAELSPSCPQLKVLTTQEALALVPCLRPDRIAGALHDPAGTDIDVHTLLQGFLKGVRRQASLHGSEIRLGMHLTQARHDGQYWVLHFADGHTVRTTQVVNATGAWADETARLFGAPSIGLVPHRRSAFTFAGPMGVDTSRWPAVVGMDESYYFKPDAGQLLGSPANADPTVPHDVVPEELDIATGIYKIQDISTLEIRRPRSTWAGLRSFVPDGEIVIGWDGLCPGFFWLAAQGGYGIQSAAGASALADALLRGTDIPETLQEQGLVAAALAPARLQTPRKM